jgi:hypothetical protein
MRLFLDMLFRIPILVVWLLSGCRHTPAQVGNNQPPPANTRGIIPYVKFKDFMNEYYK